MKLYLCLILIGLNSSATWAQELKDDKTVKKEERSLLKSFNLPEISDEDKFSDLVKTTMDLMSPNLEISQLSEEKAE